MEDIKLPEYFVNLRILIIIDSSGIPVGEKCHFSQ